MRVWLGVPLVPVALKWMSVTGVVVRVVNVNVEFWAVGLGQEMVTVGGL